MSYQKITVETRGKVGLLKLNDPAKLNAISRTMYEELGHALDDLTKSVRALILMGAGRAFCSGAALDAHADAAPNPDRDLGLVLETHTNPLMSKLRNLPIPWISAVRGAAAGVGASFALAADMVIAADNAYFLEAFARIGLVPDGGATHLLVRAIGRVRAMEMMLLAERLPAAKALEWGLVNRVVPDAALEDEAFKLASSLAEGPVVTLGLIRKAVWGALDSNWEDVLQTERRMQLIAGRTQDSEEGIAAFNEKRPPTFKGC
jgi:2-(1,2-epoxy-1,2-dihydrophenyl)acetyl-CoA isomerase